MYLSKEGAHSDAVFEPRSAVAAIRTFWSPQSASARGLDLGAHESLGAEYACGGFGPGQLGLVTLSTKDSGSTAIDDREITIESRFQNDDPEPTTM